MPPLSVYVFVGEHILLVDFVDHMYSSGYLSTGKYAIIAVDEEIYVPDVNPEWYMVKGGYPGGTWSNIGIRVVHTWSKVGMAIIQTQNQIT